MHKLGSFIVSIPLAFIGLTPSVCAQGVCNVYGCSSCGECTVYGCPPCGNNSSGYGGGYGVYGGYGGYGGYSGNSGSSGGGGRAKQICNVYGCGVSPNVYGSSPNGVCTVYGCP